MGWEKIIDIISWAKDKLPIQDRKERWKNELDKCEKERASLLISKADITRAKRLNYLDDRIKYYNGLLKNSTDAK